MLNSVFRLPGGEFDLESRELRSSCGAFPLSPRQASFLELLISQPGSVVVQDTIRNVVWPDQPNLSPGSVHQLAFEIRKTFTAAGLDPNIVETVPRRGYRISATPLSSTPLSSTPPESDATPDAESAAVPQSSPVPVEPRRRLRIGLMVFLASVTLIGLASAVVMRVQRAGRVAALCGEAYSLIEHASEPNLARANTLFRDALELEPDSAQSLAGLAEVSVRFGGADIPMVVSHGVRMSAFQSLARDAVRLDPSCARCQATLGYILGTREFHLREAETVLSTAVRLEPGQWRYHAWLAQYLAAQGQFSAALRELDAGIGTAPIATGPLTEKAGVLYLMGRYAESVELASQALALNPRAQPAMAWRARAHLMQGHWGQYVSDRAGETAIWMGWNDEAREAFALRSSSLSLEDGLRRMISINADNPTFGFERAFWHMVLNEPDLALADLEVAAKRRPFQILFLNVDPAFARLHGHPRFEAIRRGLGLR